MRSPKPQQVKHDREQVEYLVARGLIGDGSHRRKPVLYLHPAPTIDGPAVNPRTPIVTLSQWTSTPDRSWSTTSSRTRRSTRYSTTACARGSGSKPTSVEKLAHRS